jgi:hypothetical protein
MMAAKPDVNLWVFNHPLRYITEQVEFFCSALRQNGYRVKVSNRPSPSSLNVLIENFQTAAVGPIVEFCRAHKKRIAVILTEHLDFIDGQIMVHGARLHSRDDYMPPMVKMERLSNLMILREQIRCFLRLGDLPKLFNIENMIPGIPVRTVPFPTVVPTDRSSLDRPAGPDVDFVFTGQLTDYRKRILDRLQRDFKVLGGSDMVPRRRRDAMNARARLVLNIPQSKRWPWLSTMRVLAALRCRRATLALGDYEESAITPSCVCLNEQELTATRVRHALDRYEEEFRARLASYDALVRSGLNPRFPHGEFELWANLEL